MILTSSEADSYYWQGVSITTRYAKFIIKFQLIFYGNITLFLIFNVTGTYMI